MPNPIPHYHPATSACDFGLELVPSFPPSMLSRTFSIHFNKGMLASLSKYFPHSME